MTNLLIDNEQTRVIFRIWNTKLTPYRKGELIALFPDIQGYNTDDCMMYEHIGQHGEGNYPYVMSATKSAAPEECNDLKEELESIGYNLKVCKRR